MHARVHDILYTTRNIANILKNYKWSITLKIVNAVHLYIYYTYMGFPGGSVVKALPAMKEMQETWV